MKTHILLWAAFGVALSLAQRAQADLAPPRKNEILPSNKPVAIRFEVDEKAKAPRIVLPSNLLSGNGGAPANPKPRGNPNPVPKGVLSDGELETSAAPDAIENSSDNRLLFAGLAMSLSMGCGGLWLVRTKGKGHLGSLALLLAAAGMLAGTTMAWGNAGPPRIPGSFPVVWQGTTTIEVTYGSQPIRVILDRESLEKLKKGEAKPAALTPAP